MNGSNNEEKIISERRSTAVKLTDGQIDAKLASLLNQVNEEKNNVTKEKTRT